MLSNVNFKLISYSSRLEMSNMRSLSQTFKFFYEILLITCTNNHFRIFNQFLELFLNMVSLFIFKLIKENVFFIGF